MQLLITADKIGIIKKCYLLTKMTAPDLWNDLRASPDLHSRRIVNQTIRKLVRKYYEFEMDNSGYIDLMFNAGRNI